MESLVGSRVLSVDEDFVIFENDSLWGIFIKHDVEWDLFIVCCFEERVLLHLLPRQSLIRIVLHCLVEKIEAL